MCACRRWGAGPGSGPEPPSAPSFPQTLLVQPNLEILAYRQGLTPDLIVTLTQFATWKTLGAACTLQLEPASVYRALEAGEIVRQHRADARAARHEADAGTGARLAPDLVEQARTHRRLPVAVLLEFPGPAELNDALARGLPAVRLSDRLAVVARESRSTTSTSA